MGKHIRLGDEIEAEMRKLTILDTLKDVRSIRCDVMKKEEGIDCYIKFLNGESKNVKVGSTSSIGTDEDYFTTYDGHHQLRNDKGMNCIIAEPKIMGGKWLRCYSSMVADKKELKQLRSKYHPKGRYEKVVRNEIGQLTEEISRNIERGTDSDWLKEKVKKLRARLR